MKRFNGEIILIRMIREHDGRYRCYCMNNERRVFSVTRNNLFVVSCLFIIMHVNVSILIKCSFSCPELFIILLHDNYVSIRYCVICVFNLREI